MKIPLQRARRNAAVNEQLSAFEEARHTYDADRLDLQGRVQADHKMASTSVRLAGVYRDTVLPQARLALESSMAGYQTGAVDFLSVLTNFGTVLQYEMTYFDELASYHAAVSRLEEMTGAPLAH
jgi:outer membrane protein TolC